MKHIVLLTQSVLWRRLWMLQVEHTVWLFYCFPLSHAIIIKKRKLSSVQLTVLIYINQRVSSPNKLWLVNFLASVSAGGLLCIFVKWVKQYWRPTEAAFLKPCGKTMFCLHRMTWQVVCIVLYVCLCVIFKMDACLVYYHAAWSYHLRSWSLGKFIYIYIVRLIPAYRMFSSV